MMRNNISNKPSFFARSSSSVSSRCASRSSRVAELSIFHSFRSVVGASNGKEGGDACHLPAGVVAKQAPLTEIPPKVGHAPEGGNGPGLRLPVAQCWGHLKRVARWAGDSWVGDLIGAICLFGIFYFLLLFGWALS